MSNDTAQPDLSVLIAGVRFKNPVIAASGTFGYGREYQDVVDVAALGGICTKGLTLGPRPGNPGARVYETPGGLLNSIGLENPGIPAFLEQELPRLRQLGTVVVVNLAGSTIEEYAEGAALLGKAGVAMLELNISCPNVKAGGMAFGLDPDTAGSVVAAVRGRAPHTPLMVKLSPNTPDIAAVAKACVCAGADAFSLVNTFKAMAIDIYRRKPVFSNLSAGLSGPAIRPIALRMVWELADAAAGLPIVGLGGIARAADAVEFLMAGAAAVQVGSAVFPRPSTLNEIAPGIAAYMQEQGFSKLADLSIRRRYALP